jgi:purine-binding chemotaxis protein CheW
LNTEADILRERARLLARVDAQEDDSTSFEVVEFKLATERYALETRHVQGVHPLRDLTPLPGTPPFVSGIVNLRGRILPVLDLKKFFDLPERGLTDLHRIILVRGGDLEFGILADQIVGVQRIAEARLVPKLATLEGLQSDYLKGVTDDHVVVLDFERIVADPRIVVDDDTGS